MATPTTIPFTKYVDITSSVLASPVAFQRELIGRIFTPNTLVPSQSIVEFTTASAVGTYFGTSSEEYLRAAFYFSWISKGIPVSPQKISYSRWVDADTAPMIFGSKISTTLSAFQAISTGAISITLGATTNIITGLDFTGVTSLADVAGVIQAGINAETGLQWTAATVSYNSLKTSFDFVGGSTVAAVVSAQLAGSGVEILNLIGWGSSAIFSNGSLTETITDTINESIAASNNFGSFLFTYSSSLTLDQNVEAADCNYAQNPNVQFEYLIPVLAANWSSWQAELEPIGGNGVTDSTFTTGQYPEQIPMNIMASTNYNGQNTVANYMYQTAPGVIATVTDATSSDLADSLNVNYYGNTQNAGQIISFYQRGYLNGGTNDPRDMGIYSNEIWLKDAEAVALLNMLVALNSVPINDNGRAIIINTLQAPITQALANGTISVGQILTTLQIQTITTITGDPTAWYQVQNTGYWLDVQFQSFTGLNNILEYEAVYTLVYISNNVVRKVVGSQVLL